MTDILRRLHCTIRCDIETAESGCHCAEGRDTITALRAKVERLEGALVVWQNAYKTGRNEPLVQAYEHCAALGDTHE